MLPKERGWRGARLPSSGGLRWGPSPAQQGRKPAPSEGRPYLEPGRTLPRAAGAGLADRADRAGAEGGVPAQQRRREAAAQAEPRAAARATGDLRPGRTTGGAAGAAGRAPRDAGLRRAGQKCPGVGTGTSTGRLNRDPTAGCQERSPSPWGAHATTGSSGLCERFRRRSRSPAPSICTHLPGCRRSPLPGPWGWALLL